MRYKKHFEWLNLLFLSGVGLLLWIKDPANEWVSNPLSLLTSIFILSTLQFHIQHMIKITWKNGLTLPVFIVAHFVLSGFITIIFQRYFRTTEEYTFYAFDTYLLSNHTLWVDGLIWWSVYQVIFHLINQSVKLQYAAETQSLIHKELEETHRNQLRNELNPHFLFNAMNSIAMKIRLKQNKVAVDMVAALNDLLRASLKKSSKELITIKDEMALLEKYLIIENQRFDQVQVDIDFPLELHPALVPEMILQPLVENAFKHGSLSLEKPPVVTVIGKKQDKSVVITVYNDSSVPKITQFESTGIGLPNVIHRLRRNYGLAFQFKSFVVENGIAFRITIPFQIK